MAGRSILSYLNLRPLSFTLSQRLTLLIGLLACVTVQAQLSNRQQLSLPAASFSTTLQKISELYQTPILIDGQLTPLLQISPISGQMTLCEALSALVEGTPYDYGLTPAGVIIRRKAMPKESKEVVTEEEQLVISGYRDTMALAYQARFDSLGENDYLFADEMSKLPEGSVAEVLQRMPGIAITRDAGEGRQVSLRGLDPAFTQIQINGMESLATTASIDARGAINNSRRFDLNLLPTDLLTEIAVYKTPQADQDSGLSGTVALSTRRAFDYPSPQRQLGVTYRYNALGQNEGLATTALFSELNPAHTRGLLLAVSYESRQSMEKGFSSIRWAQGDWGDLSQSGRASDFLNATTIEALQSGSYYHSRYNRYDLYQRAIERAAANLSLQWLPRADWSLSFDGIAGLMKVAMDEYHISSMGLTFNDLSEIKVVEAQLQGEDLIYANLEQVDLRTEYNRQHYETHYYQVQFQVEHQLSPSHLLEVNLGSQGSNFANPLHEKVYLWAEDQAFSYDYRHHKRISVNRYGMDIEDPSNWRLYRTKKYADEVSNRFHQLKLKLSSDFGNDHTWENGFQVKSYSNRQRQWALIDDEQRGLSSEGISKLVPGRFSENLPVQGLPQTWVVATADAYDAIHPEHSFAGEPPGTANKYEEQRFALYSQWMFESDWLELPLQANFGVRRESLHYQTLANGNLAPQASHSQWLPALNLALWLAPEWKLKFNAGRTWASPDANLLIEQPSVQASSQEIFQGNSQLAPTTADALSLSLEWRPSLNHYASLGSFYKRIDGYIANSAKQIPFGETGLPLSWVADKGHDETTLYTLTQPVNGSDLPLRGVELTTLMSLWPETLNDALGFSLNYTFTDASHSYWSGESWQLKPLIGLSRHLANLILFYEGDDGGIRLAGNYRSRYLQSVPSGNGNDEDGVHDTLYLDFSAYFRIAQAWRLEMEVTNLSSEVHDQYTDSSNRPYSYTVTGPEYKLSVHHKF